MDMGRGEERVRCMERVTWKLILPYVKWIANGNLLYGLGNSNRGSVSIYRDGLRKEMGGRFKRDGIYVYLWLIHVEVWQKTTKFCKAIFFQWIMNTFFKVDFPQQRALTLMGEGLSQEWKRNNISLLSTLPGVFIAENCTVVIWNRVVEVYVKKNLRIQRKTLSLTYMESTPKHTHTTPRQPLQQAPSSLTADYSFSYDEGFFFPPISAGKSIPGIGIYLALSTQQHMKAL